ncbi:pyridoxine/pyridoxamine 5'-phosphate oxidase [Patulibacter minatonensis]|uniref:pyridoxine/pyridoxamine 5'-phosphate oxidase n=1 Tax=Patulibacter minatonensis TaxID=298163 RepID=UPI00047D41C7|nr:pyridoxal 5'-phosphate synthase [Patulibacter minatonensis]
MTAPDDLAARLRALPVFAGALPAFDAGAAPADPVALFDAWITGAIDAGVREPHAMTLATVDRQGRPNVRVLILKGVGPDGAWWFAGSRRTAKGAELDATAVAAATFYWPDQGRQVRLRGPVRDAGAAASAADFLARGPGARAETLVGRQGDTLDHEEDVEVALRHATARIEDDPERVAPAWTLWEIVADEVEFQQGDPDRRHVRLAYARTDDGWARRRLWA